MGVISRRLFPVCESMCVCCPALRSRSRQPVKRYKKLLSEIFPKTLDAHPNDRKIVKLCEYAGKNPFRLPEIAKYLEKRCYKELRSGHLNFVSIIVETYNKLLGICGEQIAYFAASFLNVTFELLDDSEQDNIWIIGCQMLTEFIYSQVDGTYSRNIENLVGKICFLASKNDGDNSGHQLRASSLQSLSAMIWFMDEFSHVFVDFEKIVSVILENFEMETQDKEDEARWDAHHNWVDNVSRCEGRGTPCAVNDFSPNSMVLRSQPERKDPSLLTREEAENPKVWAQICLQRLVDLAKESTTMRRVLDPMFVYFDTGSHWFPCQGLATIVLSDMAYFVENSGNQQIILACIVRHLDHKNVMHEPQLKSHIIQTAAYLARQIRSESVISDMGFVSDLCRHLRKCCQATAESAGEHILNAALQSSIENCLWESVRGIVDVQPLFDIMTITLENLPPVKAVAYAAMSSLIILAHVISVESIPFHSHLLKVFPEALLVQLLKVMLHSDSEIRVGGHQIFCILLTPSFSQARSGVINPRRWHSKCETTLASITDRLERLRLEKYGNKVNQGFGKDDFKQHDKVEDECKHEWSHRNSPNIHILSSIFDRTIEPTSFPDSEQSFLHCNEDQIAQSLSALWIQIIRSDNLPVNVEAIAHSFCLLFLGLRLKNSNNIILLRFFQLPISLRNLALGSNSGYLFPAYQRLLFVTSNAMLMFAAKLYHIDDLQNLLKLSASDVDPYIGIGNEFQVYLKPQSRVQEYGSTYDNDEALRNLSKFRETSFECNGLVLDILVESLSTITKIDADDIANQLSEEFVPDEVFMLGNQPMLEMDYIGRATQSKGSPSFDGCQEFSANSFAEDDAVSVSSVTDISRFTPKMPASTTPSMSQIVSIGKLLESALEVAGQVAGTSVSTSPLPYSTITTQCEAFGTDTRKKLFNWLNNDSHYRNDSNLILPSLPANSLSTVDKLPNSELSLGAVPPMNPWLSLRLPPASPFDNFLKAARGQNMTPQECNFD